VLFFFPHFHSLSGSFSLILKKEIVFLLGPGSLNHHECRDFSAPHKSYYILFFCTQPHCRQDQFERFTRRCTFTSRIRYLVSKWRTPKNLLLPQFGPLTKHNRGVLWSLLDLIGQVPKTYHLQDHSPKSPGP
jgi:hypothetical protein